MQTTESLETKEPGSGLHPLRLLLILMIVSIIMMFAAFTSGFIVRREEGNWREFDLPVSLLYNTIVIVLSSATMQWAYASARRDELGRAKLAMGLTVLLGFVFLAGQWFSWGDLIAGRTYFGGVDANPSGSFVYVLMGVHGFHLITGLVFLVKTYLKTIRYQVHSRQMMPIANCTIYWHFLGGLWLYLYLFLLLNH